MTSEPTPDVPASDALQEQELAALSSVARAELHALGNRLDAAESAILKAWREAALRDARVTTSTRLSRAQFEDHMPTLLGAFSEWLRDPKPGTLVTRRERENAIDHGLHRWHQGYDLLELTREWSLLHDCVLRQIEALCGPGIAPAAVFVVSRALARLVGESISQSVLTFQSTQQAEAQARLSDLELAHGTLQSLERARGESLRAASHDLKGGLTVVQSAAELLGTTVPHSDLLPRDQLVDILRRGVDSMSRMLSDLLDLARLEAGAERVSLDLFDAAQTLRELATTSRPLAEERGLKLLFSGPDHLEVRGDRVQTARIAQNLLLNALRYTLEGEVELTWRAESATEWSFTVRDTGPGLQHSSAAPLAGELREATRLERELVQQHGADYGGAVPPSEACGEALPAAPRDRPLETQPGTVTPSAPHSTGGEGIGLTIVKRLCELLGARLDVASGAESGTTIGVVLARELEI